MTGELQTCSYKYDYLPPGLGSPHCHWGHPYCLVYPPHPPWRLLCSPLLLTVIIFISHKLQTILNISSTEVISKSNWISKGNYVKAVDLPRDSLLSSILTPYPGPLGTGPPWGPGPPGPPIPDPPCPPLKIIQIKGFISMKISPFNNSNHYCK